MENMKYSNSPGVSNLQWSYKMIWINKVTPCRPPLLQYSTTYTAPSDVQKTALKASSVAYTVAPPGKLSEVQYSMFIAKTKVIKLI